MLFFIIYSVAGDFEPFKTKLYEQEILYRKRVTIVIMHKLLMPPSHSNEASQLFEEFKSHKSEQSLAVSS